MSARAIGVALLLGAAVGLSSFYWASHYGNSWRGAGSTAYYPPSPSSGWGMMGPGQRMMGGGRVGPQGGPGVAQGGGVTSVDDAIRGFESYISRLGDGFALLEVMEFQNNFYAVVVERDTGLGAFELLMWRDGRISPEPGPNMMWNLKYGMHPTNAQGYSASVSSEQAAEIAMDVLRKIFPGADVEVEEPIPFYGYYTVDYAVDGRMYGMLSVNAITGEIWFHTWHGGFVREVELDLEGGEF